MVGPVGIPRSSSAIYDCNGTRLPVPGYPVPGYGQGCCLAQSIDNDWNLTVQHYNCFVADIGRITTIHCRIVQLYQRGTSST